MSLGNPSSGGMGSGMGMGGSTGSAGNQMGWGNALQNMGGAGSLGQSSGWGNNMTAPNTSMASNWQGLGGGTPGATPATSQPVPGTAAAMGGNAGVPNWPGSTPTPTPTTSMASALSNPSTAAAGNSAPTPSQSSASAAGLTPGQALPSIPGAPTMTFQGDTVTPGQYFQSAFTGTPIPTQAGGFIPFTGGQPVIGTTPQDPARQAALQAAWNQAPWNQHQASTPTWQGFSGGPQATQWAAANGWPQGGSPITPDQPTGAPFTPNPVLGAGQRYLANNLALMQYSDIARQQAMLHGGVIPADPTTNKFTYPRANPGGVDGQGHPITPPPTTPPPGVNTGSGPAGGFF